MTAEKTQRYYELLEEMVDTMTQPDNFSREHFVDVLKRICELFGLSKGVTEFYRTILHEKMRDGEVLIDYDNGHGDVVVMRRRIITKSKAVIIGTLMMPMNAPALDDDEYSKVDVILRSLLSFVSRNRLQTAVERLGYYDESGYPNSRYYMRALSLLDNRGKLGGMTAASINLRHFGLINQEIGRRLGDEVMRSYFEFLEMVAGEDGTVCRFGGDNFAMVFPTALTKQVVEVAGGTPVAYDRENNKCVIVSASIGMFHIPPGFELEEPAIVLERIMSAVNMARQGKEGHVVVYDDNARRRQQVLQRLQSEFPGAVVRREFHVYYQPKVNVENGRIVGAEALCRWIRDGKVVPPGDFIPALEQGTEVCELDFYMLERVCEDLARWKQEGRHMVRVSVNFSRKHLVEPDLLEHILSVVEKYKVPHEYIEVELTETTTDVGFKDLKRVVTGLRAEGICTAVDDFGIGYSSLNLIREIPWHVIKVDRSFLPQTEAEERSITGMMYRHVVRMIREMGMECVTEGVETQRQVELLRENQCFTAQGFYFDRPLPVEEFEERINRQYYEI